MGSNQGGTSRADHRFRSVAESGVLAELLLAVVASVMVGSHAVFLGALLGFWLALGAIVGARNVLDAGCYFVVLVVGVILTVDSAANGPTTLLP